MVLHALLISATLHLTLCHPARDQTLPTVNISNPYEINNLNYFNPNFDPEPEDSKVFRRTPSDFEKSVNYLDKTVKEVESIISANSSLPRLTRGEILELIENITKTDAEQSKKQNINNATENNRDQKAVMYVMPYTPNKGDEGKIQELFTKPPVTRIVGEAPKPEIKPVNKRRRRPFPPPPQEDPFPEVIPERTTEKAPEIQTEKPPVKHTVRKPDRLTVRKPERHTVRKPEKQAETKPVKQIERKPETQSESKLQTQIGKRPEHLEKKPIINSSPQPFYNHFRPEIITQKTLSTTENPTTLKPLQELTTEKHRRQSTLKKSLTTSTEISVVTNTDSNTLQHNHRPSKVPTRHSNHKYPEEIQTFSKGALEIIEAPKLSPVKAESTTRKPEIFSYATVPPAKPSKPHRFTTADPLSNINLPEGLKSTLEDLNFGDSLSKNPNTYDSKIKYPQPPPLTDNVRDILASIGVLPATSSTTALPDISYVSDTLTPDMQQLLMTFGLLPDPSQKPPEIVKDEPVIGVPSAFVNRDSYVQFKPLPESGPTSDDMEEFLGRFGLGKSSKVRTQKALKVETPKVLTQAPQIEPDMVPESMKSILSDLGLRDREGKKISVESPNKIDEKAKKEKLNLSKTQEASKDDLEKLSQLLEIIKQLEKLNGSATEEDLGKIDMKNLKQLVGSLNTVQNVPLDEQQWAPDPVDFDEGVSKNELKRQESSTKASAIETVFTVTPATITESTKNPDIKALEDSFGGSTDSGPVATLPPPTEAPKTGFYYLLDWNSFLDIDDQKGKRVNLRFQPKVGDPKRFYSVSVP